MRQNHSFLPCPARRLSGRVDCVHGSPWEQDVPMGTARGSRGSLAVAGPRRAALCGVTGVLTPSPLLDSGEQCRQATAC